jgi:hypothetical protein
MHCFYYKEKTLTNVFLKAGFKLVKTKYLQRYNFANHLTWLLDGRAGGNPVYEKMFKAIFKKYTDLLVKEKITDTLVCIFKKI